MTRACILGCAGPDLSHGEAAFFAAADPWGFILFGRNVEDPDQLQRLTGRLREAVGRDAPILVDQEGGRVQRLRPPHWRDWPAPLDHVLAASDPIRAMWLRARLQAEELRAVGIDVNCAPTADVARPETHPFLANRCHGTDPGSVADRARAVAEGLLAGGVLPVIKHIPGHGRARVDSHRDLPVVDADRTALEDDFAPFRALRDLPLGMTAHICFPALGKHPATQDPALIRLVREEIGFDGLLMTDDISMEALGGTIADRTALAIEAGCDVVLHCNGDRAEMEQCIAASGDMGPQAQRRADRAIERRALLDGCDVAALDAELASLAVGVAHG